MKRTLFPLLLCVVAIWASFGLLSAQTKPCTPSGGLNFICGLQAAEDLVLVPDSRWLIASGMSAGSGLHLIDTQAKTARTLFGPGVATNRADKIKFAGCPGPLDPKLAVLHGLSLRPAQTGRYTLYATNHGGRESIEVFEIDARNAAPTATWTGCLLLPDMLAVNSVAAFSDGTLVATVLVLPGKTFEDVWAGRNTGVVLMWTPESGKISDSGGHRAFGKQRHRNLRRQSRVLCRLHRAQAHRNVFPRESVKTCSNGTAQRICSRQRPHGRRSFDHCRND